MIPMRLETLKFIVEEMELAFHLAMHMSDPFVARTLARHILVRAENFIGHARGLRRPLNDANYDTRDFHRTKEAYASEFEKYFKVSRHRLGAHVQDFDFGKRIELWNDIEIVKISYFVDPRNLSEPRSPKFAAIRHLWPLARACRPRRFGNASPVPASHRQPQLDGVRN
jgi:hypothetical protein